MSERGPAHLARCAAELTVMYARELAARVGAVVIDALDCFGDDSPEDAAIKSTIWSEKE